MSKVLGGLQISGAATAASFNSITGITSTLGDIKPTGTQSLGALNTVARADHVHALSAHASTHVTGGADIIANAVASGNSGLLSGADKAKLDGIASGAQVGTVTSVTTTGTVSGITLSGSVTGSGVLTLGGTLSGITNANLSGSAAISNANLANSTITVGTTSISLGASATTIAGLASVTSTSFTGALTGNATSATTVATTSSSTNISYNLACLNGSSVLYNSSVSMNPSTATITAAAFNATSRKEFKENIRPFIKSALDIINNTKIVEYNYIIDEQKTPRIGFIADDTDETISGTNHDKFDTTNTVAVLMKAIQELTERVKELEAR